MGRGTAISGPSEPRDAAPITITTNNTLYIAEDKPDSSITEQYFILETICRREQTRIGKNEILERQEQKTPSYCTEDEKG